MPTTTTTTPPSRSRGSSSILSWALGGLATAAACAALVVAFWPLSDADKARQDGEALGQAVNHLYYADSTEETEDALAEIDDAVADSREHAGDRVGEQVEAQDDALDRAVDGYVGVLTAADEFEADMYQAELDYAVDDLTDNAEDFQEEGPDVREAYWEGFEEGYNGG